MARPIPDLELMEANEAALDDRVIIDDTSDAETKAMEIEQLLKLIIPTGLITPFGGASAPDGFLLCDGANVSRTTYADLFAVIGTNYGVGDGSSTFGLPNLKGRVPVGLDTGQTEFNTLGKSGGNKIHSHALSDNGFAKIHANAGNMYLTKNPVVSWSYNTIKTAFGESGSSGSTALGVGLGGSTDNASTLQPYLTTQFVIKT